MLLLSAFSLILSNHIFASSSARSMISFTVKGGFSTPGDEYVYPISEVNTLIAISSALYIFAIAIAYSAAFIDSSEPSIPTIIFKNSIVIRQNLVGINIYDYSVNSFPCMQGRLYRLFSSMVGASCVLSYYTRQS